jgi:hypothetical protein
VHGKVNAALADGERLPRSTARRLGSRKKALAIVDRKAGDFGGKSSVSGGMKADEIGRFENRGAKCCDRPAAASVEVQGKSYRAKDHNPEA